MAHRNDVRLLEPTLDTIDQAGLLADIGVLHLDRSYDLPAVRDRLRVAGIDQFEIQRRGTKVPGVKRQPLRLGLRWVVEATNTWWSTTGSSAATPTAAHAIATLRSAWPQPSSSLAGLSTGATDGAPDERCFAFQRGVPSRSGLIAQSIGLPLRVATLALVIRALRHGSRRTIGVAATAVAALALPHPIPILVRPVPGDLLQPAREEPLAFGLTATVAEQ